MIDSSDDGGQLVLFLLQQEYIVSCQVLLDIPHQGKFNLRHSLFLHC